MQLFLQRIRIFLQRIRSETGASIVEYALLIALIAVVCIVAVTALGGDTSGTLSSAASQI